MVTGLQDASKKPGSFFGARPQHPLRFMVDTAEQYGPHVIERFARLAGKVETVVDLGAGSGRDLSIVKSVHPSATAIAVEGMQNYAEELKAITDQVYVADIERDSLPFADDSIDLIMANQVLEHTKEVFWIFHNVTRCLKVGGHFLIGVPNIASFHNRILGLFGSHPSQHKLCSAHVRPFSKNDTLKFLNACFPGGYRLVAFAGSQFYPFPRSIARPLASVFPGAAFSIFFLIRKEKPYHQQFAAYPHVAGFRTNFWRGDVEVSSQYWE